MISAQMKTVPVFCGKDCGGNACPLLVEIEGGRAMKMLHNPAGGRHIKACRRGFGLVRAHYAPDRLSRPLIRIGPRGSTSFREATWDEALDMIATRLCDIRARHGPASVLSLASAGSTGALHNTDTLTRRFLNVTGGCTTLAGSYSNGAARAVLPFLFGPQWKISGFDAATTRSAEMIILWGANLLDTRLGSELPQRLLEAKRRGAAIVVIDPRRTSTVAHASTWWMPCRPGTDAALMIATLYVLLDEGLVDRASVDSRAVGFERLERYVFGKDGGLAHTPAWAEEVCGVPAAEIRRFARAYAAARPAMLIPGFSIQRVHAGEETYRLTVALQLATGNFGMRGGSTGSMNNCLPTPRVGTLAPLAPPGQLHVPVLHWPDAILRGTSGGYPADIHAVYVAGGNYVNQGADAHKSIAAFEVYRALRVVNPSPYMYYLRMGESTVLGSSPEMLVKVSGRDVEYRPIAGTRPRGKSEEEDKRLEEELRSDSKECAEHIMLVDLGRNDVGRVSEFSTVQPRDIMFVERYSHVMHLVSQITGQLRPDADSYAALAACFPAGTLTGAPKVRAMEIIDELEPTRRGLYGGSVLYLDFSGNLNSCIVIRTVLIKDKTAYLQAGAGIVADSVPAREYDESMNKARAVLRAFELAEKGL